MPDNVCMELHPAYMPTLDENAIQERIEELARDEFAKEGLEYATWLHEIFIPWQPEFVTKMTRLMVGEVHERQVALGMAQHIRSEWFEYARNSECMRNMALRRLR